SSSFANTGSPHCLQYHTGNGTPKYLCLDIHQSQAILFTNSSYLVCIYAGCHFISFPIFIKSSLWFIISINHCFITVYSTSLPHLSCVCTSCSNSSIFTIYPPSCKSSMIFFLASF